MHLSSTINLGQHFKKNYMYTQQIKQISTNSFPIIEKK